MRIYRLISIVVYIDILVLAIDTNGKYNIKSVKINSFRILRVLHLRITIISCDIVQFTKELSEILES